MLVVQVLLCYLSFQMLWTRGSCMMWQMAPSVFLIPLLITKQGKGKKTVCELASCTFLKKHRNGSFQINSTLPSASSLNISLKVLENKEKSKGKREKVKQGKREKGMREREEITSTEIAGTEFSSVILIGI